MHPSLRKQPAGVLDQKTFLLLSCCTSSQSARSSLWIKSSVDLPSLGSRISYLLQLCEGMWKSGCVQLNSPFSPDPAKRHQAQSRDRSCQRRYVLHYTSPLVPHKRECISTVQQTSDLMSVFEVSEIAVASRERVELFTYIQCHYPTRNDHSIDKCAPMLVTMATSIEQSFS